MAFMGGFKVDLQARAIAASDLPLHSSCSNRGADQIVPCPVVVVACDLCCPDPPLCALHQGPHQILQVSLHKQPLAKPALCHFEMNKPCHSGTHGDVLLQCRGGLTDDRRGVWPVLLLTSSVSISWVFAK